MIWSEEREREVPALLEFSEVLRSWVPVSWLSEDPVSTESPAKPEPLSSVEGCAVLCDGEAPVGIWPCMTASGINVIAAKNTATRATCGMRSQQASTCER